MPNGGPWRWTLNARRHQRNLERHARRGRAWRRRHLRAQCAGLRRAARSCRCSWKSKACRRSRNTRASRKCSPRRAGVRSVQLAEAAGSARHVRGADARRRGRAADRARRQRALRTHRSDGRRYDRISLRHTADVAPPAQLHLPGAHRAHLADHRSRCRRASTGRRWSWSRCARFPTGSTAGWPSASTGPRISARSSIRWPTNYCWWRCSSPPPG